MSAASAGDAAICAGVRTHRYARFIDRYNTTTTITPRTLALARFRAGSRISAATFAQLCQPPYAKRIGTSAVNRRCTDALANTEAGAGSKWLAGGAPRPNAGGERGDIPATLAAHNKV